MYEFDDIVKLIGTIHKRPIAEKYLPIFQIFYEKVQEKSNPGHFSEIPPFREVFLFMALFIFIYVAKIDRYYVGAFAKPTSRMYEHNIGHL